MFRGVQTSSLNNVEEPSQESRVNFLFESVIFFDYPVGTRFDFPPKGRVWILERFALCFRCVQITETVQTVVHGTTAMRFDYTTHRSYCLLSTKLLSLEYEITVS